MYRQKRGFTKFTNDLFDGLLSVSLTSYEIRVLLLIIRLTYGCRKEWALLKLKDFEAIGIHSTHITKTLNSLTNKELILWKKESKRFKINEMALIAASEQERQGKIRELIGTNLKRESYKNSHFTITKIDNDQLPKVKVDSYTSSNMLELTVSSHKYNIKENKIYADNNVINYSELNPYEFIPQTEPEAIALEAWKKLSGKDVSSFSTILGITHTVPEAILETILDEVYGLPYNERLPMFINKIEGWINMYKEDS